MSQEKTKTWEQRMLDAAQEYAAREPFRYDLSSDPLYGAYREQYLRQGRLAMQDTIGQAAAANGGYGTSYGQTAGQQAYNAQLSALNDRIPQLYQIALERYQNAGTELLNQYQFAAQQAEAAGAASAASGTSASGGKKMNLLQAALLAKREQEEGTGNSEIRKTLLASGMTKSEAKKALELTPRITLAGNGGKTTGRKAR